jgi:glycosyltransferase involved in cell wall biosynthesis
MPPDVSVVIPTHNRRAYLEGAIQSCLTGNDAIDVEVIVVDDGSTDGTREYLRALDDERVRPFFQEHQGAQRARNRGLDEAEGWAIKFLDDDDYLLPGALADQHALLKTSGVDVCYGDHRAYSEADDETLYTANNDRFENFFVGVATWKVKRNPLIFLFRRAAIAQVRWDESLDYLQDVAFMLDAGSQHLTCRKLEAIVAVRRVHENGSISETRSEAPAASKHNLRGEMYWSAYQQLAANGPVSAAHRRAAAAGLWRQAHLLAPLSFRDFTKWYEKAMVADPAFLPPRRNALLEMLDRVASPKLTEWLINPIRRTSLKG